VEIKLLPFQCDEVAGIDQLGHTSLGTSGWLRWICSRYVANAESGRGVLEIPALMLHDTGLLLAAADAYPYIRVGSSDDDFDDGAESLMSRVSCVTHEEGLRLAEKCACGAHVTPVTGQNHSEL
jgi:hypothetical protein